MTNQQTTQTINRPFRMLIGDDSYVNKRTANNALTCMLCGIAEVVDSTCMEGEFVNDIDYVNPEFPLKEFNGAEIKVVSSVEEMVRESSGNYDWIATDMNYGEGYETGGRDVLRNSGIRSNPAVKAIFTSESNPRVLEELAQMGADVVISPALMNSMEPKVILLGRAIAEYYKNRKK